MNGNASAIDTTRINKGEIGRHAYVVDFPTLFLAFGIYCVFLAVTWFYHDLPWWLVLPLGASTVCLHGSLQHEGVHGYPFRKPSLNRWVSGWPLWLWVPYDTYVATHTRHHVDHDLTDPLVDPESNYLTGGQLAKMSAPHLAVRHLMRSLGGRMLLGPAYYTFWSARDFCTALISGDPLRIRPWLWHMIAVTLILTWVMGVCDIPFFAYVAMFAYPGTSMALVRSFAEHRAAGDEKQRSIVCEAGPYWSFLFLHNNIHALHHAEPALAWYRRPARYRELKDQLVRDNGHYFIRGYAPLFRAYFFRPKEPLLHPLMQDR